MKYKVGDKVRIREDLVSGENYGVAIAVNRMTYMGGSVVTIESFVTIKTVDKVLGYYIEEDPNGYLWTDEMFEPVEEELTVAEAIRLYSKMCEINSCALCKLSAENNSTGLSCRNFAREHHDKLVEILKQWKKDHEKKDHEKKDVEVEFVSIVRVIEDLGYTKKCVYEEDVTEVKDETFKMSMKRILKEYCKEHEGKFFTVYEETCRVKE